MKCCDLSPGKLRHIVDLQEEVKTSDDGGGTTLAWVTFSHGQRAMLKPISGGERLFAQRIESTVTHRAWMRYRTDLTTVHRLMYDGRAMQVRAVINMEERDRWLELYLEEGVAT